MIRVYIVFIDLGKLPDKTINTELIDLIINISLRKSVVTVERIQVCYVIEKLAERGIHSLPCFGMNDVIYTPPYQLTVHTDVLVKSPRLRSAKVLSTTVGSSKIATVI